RRAEANPVRFRTLLEGAQAGDERAQVLRERRREAHPFAGRRMGQRQFVGVQRLPDVAESAALVGGQERVELSARRRRRPALGELEEVPLVGTVALVAEQREPGGEQMCAGVLRASGRWCAWYEQ